jgi:4-diphosphocytidyl-2-C-methyl-D-erythritol kinase
MRPTTNELAPAKLNLALSVGAPGVDRMHPIASWMVTLDLCDELTLSRLEEGSLSRYAIVWHDDARKRSEIDWSITTDLAVRAHQALETASNRELPMQLLLKKRIPVGGGLGGGSSDAAAMLRATNRLFELGMSDEELVELATGLGSDVPFLVRGGSAIVEGLGERIEAHVRTPELDLVLVFPSAACPTGPVYAAFDTLGNATLRPDAVRALANGRLLPTAPFNDLYEAAATVAPALREARASIETIADRAAHLSGSGSTFFVICDAAVHAEALARAIEDRLGLPAVATRTGAGQASVEQPRNLS